MSASDITEIESPCIGVCTMSEATGLCLGCFRTIEEIRQWWDMDDGSRRLVMDQLGERQINTASFD